MCMCYVDAEKAALHTVWMLTGLLTYVDADGDLSLCRLPACGENLCGPGIVSDTGKIQMLGWTWALPSGEENGQFYFIFASNRKCRASGFCVIRLKLGTPSW